MTIKKASTSTCITTKNARRSQVWEKFLEIRTTALARGGVRPILMDTCAGARGSARGWSYVAVPAKVQKKWGTVPVPGHAIKSGPTFTGGWAGFMTYEGKPHFLWCDKVYAFQVTCEDGRDFVRAHKCKFFVKNFKSTITRARYREQFKKIQKYLRDGESYQVNFAQNFVGDFSGDPFFLYASAFSVNPSAMCFYMEIPPQRGKAATTICSNSPERLFSLRDGILRTEPVKGTVGILEDPAFLLSDKKSYSELTMIVDLMRNDLARVSEIGSVKVVKHQELMKLKSVWHTFSVIEGRLREGLSAFDVLGALFPGGSVTGCPKVRTMEIISRLENFERGAYCGSAGYISETGDADFNIMIRTATVSARADGRGGADAYKCAKSGAQVNFPSGGGITVGSTCSGEYEETLKKVAAFKEAVK